MAEETAHIMVTGKEEEGEKERKGWDPILSPVT
jgi:hypothetical protein